jgi:hypothetical protein
MKKWLEYPIFELFSNRKYRGLIPWLVDQHWRVPWWTAHHGRLWSSPKLSLAAALSHGGFPQGGEKKEGTTGSLFWLVPRLGKRRGGSAVGTFTRDGLAFYRAEARRGRPSAFNGGVEGASILPV